MVLRPLVERTEWRGCAARNPDPVAYAALYNSIRDRFFVVSLADLVPGVEEMVTDLDADICLHKGEAGCRGDRRLDGARGTDVLLAGICGAVVTGGRDAGDRRLRRFRMLAIVQLWASVCANARHRSDQSVPVLFAYP